MPYIKQSDRERYDVPILVLTNKLVGQSCGDLNYVLTKLIHQFVPAPLSYKSLNEVIGVLECAKLELFRKVVAPYEDIKRAETGSVSNLDWQI